MPDDEPIYTQYQYFEWVRSREAERDLVGWEGRWFCLGSVCRRRAGAGRRRAMPSGVTTAAGSLNCNRLNLVFRIDMNC